MSARRVKGRDAAEIGIGAEGPDLQDHIGVAEEIGAAGDPSAASDVMAIRKARGLTSRGLDDSGNSGLLQSLAVTRYERYPALSWERFFGNCNREGQLHPPAEIICQVASPLRITVSASWRQLRR